MQFKRKNPRSFGRCAKCGCETTFDGIVDLDGQQEGGFQTMASFRCNNPECQHGFVDLMAWREAQALESRLVATY